MSQCVLRHTWGKDERDTDESESRYFTWCALKRKKVNNRDRTFNQQWTDSVMLILPTGSSEPVARISYVLRALQLVKTTMFMPLWGAQIQTKGTVNEELILNIAEIWKCTLFDLSVVHYILTTLLLQTVYGIELLYNVMFTWGNCL